MSCVYGEHSLKYVTGPGQYKPWTCQEVRDNPSGRVIPLKTRMCESPLN